MSEKIYHIIGPNWSHTILVREDGTVAHSDYALKLFGIVAGVPFAIVQDKARQNGWRILPEETVFES